MNRLIIIFSIFMFSCSVIQKMPEVSLNGKVVTLDKVKVKISNGNFDDIVLKGYIGIVRDSLVCFNLNGPLGLKVLGGKFDDRFIVKDYYNNKLYNDIINELIKKSGIIFNKVCIENLLLSKVDTLANILFNLNKGAIKLNREELGKKVTLTLMNSVKNNSYKFEFLNKKKVIHEIDIFYQGYNDRWEVKIEVVSITNIEKKCNFGF